MARFGLSKKKPPTVTDFWEIPDLLWPTELPTGSDLLVSSKNFKVVPNLEEFPIFYEVNDPTGPSYPIDTACSSSISALECAYRDIRNGTVDSAVVAGCNLCLNTVLAGMLCEMGAISKTGSCKSFDESGKNFDLRYPAFWCPKIDFLNIFTQLMDIADLKA